MDQALGANDDMGKPNVYVFFAHDYALNEPN
jgi:hypothetical protein